MKLGYTIIYVANVPEAVTFYRDAFGLKERSMHESNLYGEMETGETVLAFADESSVELGGVAFVPNERKAAPAGWEIAFVTDDVGASFDRAVAAGCAPVLTPAEKPWGQLVSYVRDINGCLVEICSPVGG